LARTGQSAIARYLAASSQFLGEVKHCAYEGLARKKYVVFSTTSRSLDETVVFVDAVQCTVTCNAGRPIRNRRADFYAKQDRFAERSQCPSFTAEQICKKRTKKNNMKNAAYDSF